MFFNYVFCLLLEEPDCNALSLLFCARGLNVVRLRKCRSRTINSASVPALIFFAGKCLSFVAVACYMPSSCAVTMPFSSAFFLISTYSPARLVDM